MNFERLSQRVQDAVGRAGPALGVLSKAGGLRAASAALHAAGRSDLAQIVAALAGMSERKHGASRRAHVPADALRPTSASATDVEAFAAPGEVLTRLALPLRASMGSRHRMFFGLTHDTLGYFLPEDEWMTGRNNNYEESVSLGKHAGAILAGALLAHGAASPGGHMRLPLVTSHAACKGHAPENTLAGIERAIALGADAIEIDVHCTSDRVPVLIHDETVDRTTDGAGSIHEMPLDVARALDAGARQFVPRFQGEKIPTLAEVLDLTKGKVLLQIEIKQPDIEDDVARVVRAAGALADCETHSFWPADRERMRDVEPRMAAALLTDGRRVVDWADFFGFALSLNAQGISVYHAFATPETRARWASCRSLTFMTWTVDDEADMDEDGRRPASTASAATSRTSSAASSMPRRGRRRGDRPLLCRVAFSYTSGAQECSSVGRAAVSKTAGRGFESLHSCHVSSWSRSIVCRAAAGSAPCP